MKIQVLASRPATDKYRRMLAAYTACHQADVDIPDEVQEFFKYQSPYTFLKEEDVSALVVTSDLGNRHLVEIDITLLPDGRDLLRILIEK